MRLHFVVHDVDVSLHDASEHDDIAVRAFLTERVIVQLQVHLQAFRRGERLAARVANVDIARWWCRQFPLSCLCLD